MSRMEASDKDNEQVFTRSARACSGGWCCDDAVFSQVRANRIDHWGRALPDAELTGPMQHYLSLLTYFLHSYKSHRWRDATL
jgi:hypothetical protein